MTRLGAVVFGSLLCVSIAVNTRAYAQSVVDANTIPCVNYTPHYTDIQTAINNAFPGGTIAVCPGTYAQQITINKSLTLRGVTNKAANTGAAVITPPSTGLLPASGFYPVGLCCQFAVQVFVQANTTNVNFVDIAIDGAGAFPSCVFGVPSIAGIVFDANSSGALRRVALRNHNVPNGSGGYCSFGGPSAPPYGIGVLAPGAGSVTIQDSSVRGFSTEGFAGFGATSFVISTTPFVGVSKAETTSCIYANAATVQLSNNTVTNCGSGIDVSYTTPSSSITGNTVTNVGGGISCQFTCPGGNISGNTIAGVDYVAIGGLDIGFTGSTFRDNDISGALAGIDLLGGNNNTVSYNTINDAAYGIVGTTYNTVSNNTFLNVTTLTQ